MLLERTRLLAWGAMFTALGVCLAAASIYTPFAPRMLLLASGLPVLVSGKLFGPRGSSLVYSSTGLIILFLIQPLKGAAYLCITGAIPLLLSYGTRFVYVALAALGLSGTYLLLCLKLFGISLDALQKLVAQWLPGLSLPILLCSSIAIFSIVYPWFLQAIGREMERHWLFQQIFKR